MSTKKPTKDTDATTAPEATGESVQSEVRKSKTEHNSPEDYSSSSLIARAYSAGYFPSFTHQKLFHSIVKLLDGKNEGSVDFTKVLEDAGIHKSSALQIIRHIVAWNILAVSFNSSHVIGEGRKSWAYLKILRNLDAYEQLPKSA